MTLLLEHASWDVFHRTTSMARALARSLFGPGESAHFTFMIRGAMAFALWMKKPCLPDSSDSNKRRLEYLLLVPSVLSLHVFSPRKGHYANLPKQRSMIP